MTVVQKIPPKLDIKGNYKPRRACRDRPPIRHDNAAATDARRGAARGAAPLEIALKRHLGKNRGKMTGKTGHHRRHAFEPGASPAEKVAELLPRHIDVAPVAIDEIHRHIERVIDVT